MGKKVLISNDVWDRMAPIIAKLDITVVEFTDLLIIYSLDLMDTDSLDWYKENAIQRATDMIDRRMENK